jgi:hypothetical protein
MTNDNRFSLYFFWGGGGRRGNYYEIKGMKTTQRRIKGNAT